MEACKKISSANTHAANRMACPKVISHAGERDSKRFEFGQSIYEVPKRVPYRSSFQTSKTSNRRR